MKQIKPVSIWDKGTTYQAEIMNAYGTFTQLGKSAQFYYQLFAKKETSMVKFVEVEEEAQVEEEETQTESTDEQEGFVDES